MEHLTKLDKLEYLDLSNNLIKEVARLSPLKRVKNLTVCITGNPFLKGDGWKPLLDSFRFAVEKQARDYSSEVKPKAEAPPVDKHHDELLNSVRIASPSDLLNSDISPQRLLDKRNAIRRHRTTLHEDPHGFEILMERRLQESYERDLTERNERVHNLFEDSLLGRVRRRPPIVQEDPEPSLIPRSDSD